MNSNKRYLMVDADATSKSKYKWSREFAFNDFENVPVVDGVENTNRFFAEHNIPKEYRKIVLVVPNNLKLGGNSKKTYEFVTHIPFNVKLEKTSNGYTISGKTISNDICGSMHFESPSETVDFKVVREFYLGLEKLGLLDNYFDTLFEIFAWERTSFQDKVMEEVVWSKFKAINRFVGH